MRYLLLLGLLLAGCASHEYSDTPEPQGEWVPANPVSFLQAAPPPPVSVVAPRRKWVRK